MSESLYSQAGKQAWMAQAMPKGTRIVVVDYDEPEHNGKFGTVIGHDLGHSDSLPATRCKLDDGYTDLFFDEEIRRL